ncbi:MAG: glycosyltransferase [Pyrinomonadaceae bacterium]
MSLRTLYLCYFGLREPLVQTQVLPYLRQLTAAGIKVHLLTFEPQLREKWNEDELTNQRALLAKEGISWFFLPYHKSPSVPATAYDIMAGARFAVQLARREGIDVLHARAHVPMAMALWARRFARVKVIFDIRGLMAEEYADAGIWTEGSLPFRLVKSLERAGIRRADQIVVLTERLRDWLIARKLKSAEQIEVIPCCVDFARFDASRAERADATTQHFAADRFEVVYAGSLMGLYLVEEMGRFFKAIKAQRPGAFLRILSVSPPAEGVAALKRAGLEENDFEITAVTAADVPEHLRRARLGISFRKPAFAQIAASPTKIPEYLAAGLPVVCNAGIGDMDELVERQQVGVVLHSFDDAAYQKGATQALLLAEETGLRERAVRIAHQYFDLTTIGVRGYVNVYGRLEENPLR